MRISDSIKIFKPEQFTLPVSTTLPLTIWENSPKEKLDLDAQTDSFVPTSDPLVLCKITPQGTDDKYVLAQAPKPDIVIAGKKKKAGIVVDLTNNVLYRYDSSGNPTKAYLVASGAKKNPTEKGIRIVTHTETYPYKKAYGTKRKRNPEDYGPFVIVLEKINPKTGEQSKTGEFIHGCKSYEETFKTDPKRYVSHGCVRMENGAITEVKEVQKGTIVIIK